MVTVGCNWICRESICVCFTGKITLKLLQLKCATSPNTCFEPLCLTIQLILLQPHTWAGRKGFTLETLKIIFYAGGFLRNENDHLKDKKPHREIGVLGCTSQRKGYSNEMQAA